MGIVSISALIFTYVQLDNLRTEVGGLRMIINDNMQTMTTLLEEKQKQLDSLRSAVDKNVASIYEQGQGLVKVTSNFANMKTDLAGEASKSITKEIIDAATDQEIIKAVHEFALNRGDKFVEELGNELATSHRSELTGPRGRDADDERVATFLLARPEFLDAVSVSLLQLQQVQGK
jgi:hypothetical protein